MRRLLPVTLLAAAVALALALVPAAIGASKAKIVLDPGCFLSSGSGLLSGSGFRPNSSWTAKLAGTKQIGTGRIDARGKIRARFTAPRYHGTAGTREMTLSVTDGPHVASTTFLMSPLDAGFSPRTGDPATLRVRWRVLGLGAAPRRVRALRPAERQAQADAADRHDERALRLAQDRPDRALPVQIRATGRGPSRSTRTTPTERRPPPAC